MTQPDLIGLYNNRASARLKSAGFLLKNAPACQFTAGADPDLTRSNIGMTIWSAAIDVGSILMLQQRGTETTGRSPEISRFITKDLDQQHPELNLSTAWSALVQLHNIQHRAGHDTRRFGTAARTARRSLALLNHLIAPAHQIDPRSYSWLARVREEYVDPFRDDPTTVWSPIQPETLNTPHPATGSVPLHWAAQNIDPDAIDILVNHGARVHTRDSARQTPLHWAARSGWAGNDPQSDTSRGRCRSKIQSRKPSPLRRRLQRLRRRRSAHKPSMRREQARPTPRDPTSLGSALATGRRSGATANRRRGPKRYPKFHRTEPSRHSIGVRFILRGPARCISSWAYTRQQSVRSGKRKV